MKIVRFITVHNCLLPSSCAEADELFFRLEKPRWCTRADRFIHNKSTYAPFGMEHPNTTVCCLILFSQETRYLSRSSTDTLPEPHMWYHTTG